MKKNILCVLIVSLLFASTVLVTGSDLTTARDTNLLVRIDLSHGEVTLPRGIEIVGQSPGEWVDIILPQAHLQDLIDADLPYSILINDVDTYSQSFAGQYHTFAEIEQILQTIATNYPSITHLSSLGKSYQNRDLWCLEISDNPQVDEQEPGVFFMGLHHAREWPTVEICLNIANKLTSEYSTNTTIQNLVNNRRIWIVPCVNPDGYYRSHDQGQDWRKNMHYFPEYGSTGVDLNRNYAGSTNGNAWGEWGSIHNGAATHNPPSEVFCGPSPMSELETQVIRDMFLENNICATITWHTYSELVMWPWGYLGSQHAPDNTYLMQIGQQIASRITKDSGYGTYTPQQSAALYPTTGDTTDWAYGYGYYEQGRPTFAYTIEACSQFQPSASKLDQICKENYEGAIYMLEEAENINQVVPCVLPPVIDDIPNDPDGTYTVSWEQQNPAAQPDTYQLDELSGFHATTDDAETSSTLWTIEGFSLSTTRAHSGTSSYLSRHQSNYVSSMTTTQPLPVQSGMSLSFWCWYDIENQWDYAFVEVSTDGRSYDILDSFTGASSGWVQKQYALSSYAGTSIFIRFRYTTDEETLREGFYVDDITPVPQFETITTLSSSIPDQSYEITGNTNGTYYYRVRGNNLERGWGDFSILQKVIVGSGEDQIPPTLEITSPKEHYLYLRNRAVIPFFVTLLFGATDITVNTTDSSGIDRVEFYLDETLVGTVTSAPYTWTWNTTAFFRHTIKIISVDTYENAATSEMKVWKFF